VVKWISRLTSDQLFRVRILAEALLRLVKKRSFEVQTLEIKTSDMVSYRAGGYGSVVEQLVANQLTRVRFSLPAQKSLLRVFWFCGEVWIKVFTLGIKDRGLFEESVK
jgi:hypothetical protein